MPDLLVQYKRPVLPLAAVRRYLEQSGYQCIDRRGAPGTLDTPLWETWSGVDPELWVELPCWEEARDFPRRLSEFLTNLAALEGCATGPLYDRIAALVVIPLAPGQ